MKKKIKILTEKEINALKAQFQPLKFTTDFDLVYEYQVPNTGVVLLNGELALLQKRKVKSKVEPGSLLGIHQLLNNLPVEMGWRVRGNTELIMIQKSDILDALADKRSELYEILKENC